LALLHSADRSRISAVIGRSSSSHRKWLDEKTYADLVALSQFLPGPASTKVGIAVGFFRAGYPGALIAWQASPCLRRLRWCCSPTASRRSAMRSAAAGCTA
jgi:hypothetical protein